MLVPFDQEYQWTEDTDTATCWLLGSTAQRTSDFCMLQNFTAPPALPSNSTDSIFPKLSSYRHTSGSRNKFCLLCYGNLVHNRHVIGESSSVLIHCWRPESHCIYYWVLPPQQVLGLKPTIQQFQHSKNVDLAIKPKRILAPPLIFLPFLPVFALDVNHKHNQIYPGSKMIPLWR